MVDVMGGPESAGFNKFVSMVVQGMLALHEDHHKIQLLVEIMLQACPSFPCFKGGRSLLDTLKQRLFVNSNKREVVMAAMKLVEKSKGSWRTRQVRTFRRLLPWC